MTDHALLKKYDIQAPRYTSYPTVPYWSHSPTTEEWIQSLNQAFENPSTSWSLYLHIPFCESLCTFCGCNTIITRNHQVEVPYVKTILKEFSLYCDQVGQFKKAPLKQIHLGGGTPTFLSAQQLELMVSKLLSNISGLDKNFEGSVEVDPRRTTKDQLEALYGVGFRRISLGVQDFNPEVQKIVNRVQPYELTKKVTDEARQIGYDSVNYDLIYGLPKQNKEAFLKTAQQTIELRPDRIALYSFAMVPWIRPAQRLFKDEDVPVGDLKRELYEVAYDTLTQAGYHEIGMDHFALEKDELYKAHQQKKLHRNFMGYTDQRTDILLGLGVSSISESPTCFHQNEKVLPIYERKIGENLIPTLRGHLLTEEDRTQRQLILKFMTQMRVELPSEEIAHDIENYLKELIEDDLVHVRGKELSITERGKPFLRNACMALDLRLRSAKPNSSVFSRSL